MSKKTYEFFNNRNAYLRVEPPQLTTPRQIDRWHGFLKDFVLCLCRSDPVALIFHDACDEGPIFIPRSQASMTRSSSGETYRIYELLEMTADIFDEHVVGANEFIQNIDLFIWKPTVLIQNSQIQQIIEWRDSMFNQPVPFSEIIATKECIGFPSEDGECFYWVNPDVSFSHLESMAMARGIKLTEFNWE